MYKVMRLLGVTALPVLLVVTASCGSSNSPVTSRTTTTDVSQFVESIEGVKRIDSLNVKETTWGTWRMVSSDDPDFDSDPQPAEDSRAVTVYAVTGHVEPLTGQGATDWGLIVLDSETRLELERYTGRGEIPKFFSRL